MKGIRAIIKLICQKSKEYRKHAWDQVNKKSKSVKASREMNARGMFFLVTLI